MTSLRPLGLSAVDRARVEEVSLITGAGAAVDLVELLSEPSWAVRRAVVACLARMGSAIEPLCAVLLGDRRDETKFAAAVEALAGLMASADDNVAAAAAEALGRIGGAGIIGPLIVAVESGNVFRAFPAIAPLGRSADPKRPHLCP